MQVANLQHFEVCQFLEPLTNHQCIQLGGALGLNHFKLEKMRNFPSDLVSAWIRREDNVLTKSGDPTWNTLIVALETIGQKGVAQDIIRTVEGARSHKSTRQESESNATDLMVAVGAAISGGSYYILSYSRI